MSIGDSPVGETSVKNEFLSDENIVIINPNPANNYAFLALDLEEVSTDVEIIIYDSKGQAVSSQSLENIQKAQTELDLRDFPEGFYFVRVQTDAGVTTRRLVVNR